MIYPNDISQLLSRYWFSLFLFYELWISVRNYTVTIIIVTITQGLAIKLTIKQLKWKRKWNTRRQRVTGKTERPAYCSSLVEA